MAVKAMGDQKLISNEGKLPSVQKLTGDENNLSELDKVTGGTKCLEEQGMPKIVVEEPDIILARSRRHFFVQDEVVLILSTDMVQYIVDSWEGEPCKRSVFMDPEVVPKDHQEDKSGEERPVEDTVTSPDGKSRSAAQSPDAKTTKSEIVDKGKKRRKKGTEGSFQELAEDTVNSYKQSKGGEGSTTLKKRGGKERKMKDGHRSDNEFKGSLDSQVEIQDLNTSVLDQAVDSELDKVLIYATNLKRNQDYATKDELQRLCNMNRSHLKRYIVDEMLHNEGHTVLRFPPYHSFFNAIEFAWSVAKQYYNKTVASRPGHGLDRATAVWKESLDQKEATSVGPVEWRIEVADEDVKIKFKQGNFYDGRVSNKFMEGKGKYMWTDGSVYEGDFQDGQMTGRGRLDWPDLSWYEGEFYRGYRHGTGTYVCSAAHIIYIGHWFMGHKNGEGILYYSENLNDFYDGDWVMDVRHGEGLRKYPSRSCYIGEWLYGVRHGLGTMIWPNNHLYRGHWKNGLMDGYGEYTWAAFLNTDFAFPMENIYRGCWKTGVRQGYGTLELAGGGIYCGWWENNAKCGKGVVICRDGRIERGDSLFYEDRPIIKRHISENQQEIIVRKKSKKRLRKNPSVLREKSNHLTHTVSANPMRKGSYEILPLQIPVHAPGQAINLHYHIERWEKHYKNDMQKPVIINVENGDENEQDQQTPNETETSASQSVLDNQEKEPKQISGETEITESPHKLEDTESEYKQISAEVETTVSHSKLKLKSEEKLVKQTIRDSTTTMSRSKLKLKSEEKVIKQTTGDTTAALSHSKLKFQEKNAKKVASETDKLIHLKASKTRVKKAKSAHNAFETSKGDTTSPIPKEFCIGTYEYEKKWLNNAIIKHLLELRTVYKSYATLACKEQPKYDSVLVRMLLWQLFRDCGLHKRDISLIELDEIFAENPHSLIKNIHSPFELIYFWQYLHILLDLSWIFYASKNIGRENCPGVLGSAFQKLILEDILPNAGHHIGSALLDKQSVLPFNATYMFYKSVGEPHTARYFLNRVCGKIKEQTQVSSNPLYIPVYPQHILEGTNAIGVSGDVMYLPGPEPLTLPSKNLKGMQSEKISAEIGDLSNLHNVGAIGVVECLIAVCPGIKSEDGLICKMMYPLTFLEFYEVLLLCADVSIKKDAQRLKRLAALEEQRKLAELARTPTVDKMETLRSVSVISTRLKGKKKRRS